MECELLRIQTRFVCQSIEYPSLPYALEKFGELDFVASSLLHDEKTSRWKTWNKPKTMSNHVQNYIYIYMPMWFPFNGMLIIASCVLWVICILRNLTWTIGSFDFEFWYEQRTFKVEQVFCQTLLVSQRGPWFS